jgi:hypothetical protein
VLLLVRRWSRHRRERRGARARRRDARAHPARMAEGER